MRTRTHHSRPASARRCGPWLFAGCLFALSAAGPAQDQDQLVQLDGRVKAARVTGIHGGGNAGGRVELAGPAGETVDLYTLPRIERPTKPVAAQPAAEVQLVGGGELFARQVTLNDSRFRILWGAADTVRPLELPMERVRAVRFRGADPDKTAQLTGFGNFARTRDREDNRDDRLFVVAGESVQSVSGFLEALTADRLAFRYEDRTRSIDIAKVVGVVLARSPSRADHAGHCRARMADGSWLWGRMVKLEGGNLVLALAEGVEAPLPWDTLVRLDIRSDRVVFCSDLDPVRVSQQSSLTGDWVWRRDCSVLGNPLVLSGVTYERGLGVHADCTLEFDVGRRCDLFAATIGIDGETKGRGDCLFQVHGDGKPLFQQRMRGSDQPVEVRVSIAGVRIVQLVVLQGEDWDLADHADWGDARFVRE
jgi:hypothetical protein